MDGSKEATFVDSLFLWSPKLCSSGWRMQGLQVEEEVTKITLPWEHPLDHKHFREWQASQDPSLCYSSFYECLSKK